MPSLMMQSRVSPQASTISALLPASSITVDLRAGKEIHGYSVAMGFEEDVYVRTTLIDMYAKCVLTACSHAGMVDLGEGLFSMMQEKYGIVPRLEHYACMVDLLGRAGKVDEVYGIVQRMPIEADLFVWGALLGACRQHNCLDLAEIATKRLAKLEPKSSGSSVVLSSLYGEYSRWENVLKVKKTTKKKKLRSFTGCSWIQVV
ncbi:hypothetical protein ACS0TY_014238 [Phlomoides rotata]